MPFSRASTSPPLKTLGVVGVGKLEVDLPRFDELQVHGNVAAELSEQLSFSCFEASGFAPCDGGGA